MVVDSQTYNASLSNFVIFYYLEQVWLTALKVECLEKVPVSININQNFTALFSSCFNKFVAIFTLQLSAIVKIAANSCSIQLQQGGTTFSLLPAAKHPINSLTAATSLGHFFYKFTF